MKKHPLQRGFTLMELMVVIIIVAILAAVAVPLYINYVKDARRTEAKGAIAAVISAQQIYYQEFGEYADQLTLLKVDLTDLASNWSFALSGGGQGSTTFKVDATGQGDAANLTVCCSYTKGLNPTWGDEVNPCP
jgi:type IV pilus assembly protein PilE